MLKNGLATIESSTDGLIITIPSEKRWGIIYFHIFFAVVLLAFALIPFVVPLLGYQLVANPKNSSFLVFSLSLAFIGFPTIASLRWYLFGYEIVHINAETLKIYKVGTLFSIPLSIPKSEIKDVQVVYKPFMEIPKTRNLDYIFPWLNEGRIGFKAGAQSCFIGQDVPDVEAKYIVHQMVKGGYLQQTHFKSIDEYNRFLKMF